MMFDTSLDDETFFKDYQSTLWYRQIVSAQQLLKSRILLIVSGFFTFSPLFLLSLRTYFEAEVSAWVYLAFFAVIGLSSLLLWKRQHLDGLARLLTFLFFVVIPVSYYLPGAYQVQFMAILCFPFLVAGLYNSFSAAIQTQMFFIWICICWLPHVTGVVKTAYFSKSISLWMMVLGSYVLLSLVGILTKRYHEDFFRSIVELIHYDRHSGLVNANDLEHTDEWTHARWLVLVQVDYLTEIIAIGGVSMRAKVLELVGALLQKKVPTFPFTAYQWSDGQMVLLLSELTPRAEGHLEVSLYKYIDQLNRQLNESSLASRYLISVTAACAAINGRSPYQVVADCQLAVHKARKKQLPCVMLNDVFKVEQFDFSSREKYQTLNVNLLERKSVIAAQPVFSVRTGKVAWYDCALRIDNLEDGFKPLCRYLGIAQKFGLYEQVSDHLLQHMVNYLHEFKTNVSVDLLLADLLNARIYKALFDLCQLTSSLEVKLILNITLPPEQFDVERCQEIMRILRQQGAKIALAQFGNMAVQVGVLVTLPFDIVKIEQHLISDMINDVRKERLVKAVLSFCHTNQQTVVASGIESEQLKMAAEALGFNYVQGNYLAAAKVYENRRFIEEPGRPLSSK